MDRETRIQEIDKKEFYGGKTVISYSQYKKYSECPRAWQYRYRDKKRLPSDSIHTIFGKAIHETIQLYLDTMYMDTVKAANALELDLILKHKLKEEFLAAKKKFQKSEETDKQFPCTVEDMTEFYQDGLNILKEFKKHRSDYFNTRTTELISIEEPIIKEVKSGVHFAAFLDVIIRNKNTGKYTIIDIKTSTKGWNKWKKKDKVLVNQVVAYKNFYAEKLGVDPDQIKVMYLIVKRKLYEDLDWPQKRLQEYSPANGSITQNKIDQEIKDFVNEAFDENGNYVKRDLEIKPEKYKCAFCEYSVQFGDIPICDQGGNRWSKDDYSENMQPYLDFNGGE